MDQKERKIMVAQNHFTKKNKCSRRERNRSFGDEMKELLNNYFRKKEM